MTVYLIGVWVSAVVWFLLIKFRQGGYYIRMPNKQMGNLMDPLDRSDVDYSQVMIGWFIVIFAWPVAWSLLIGIYVFAWIGELFCRLWINTVGNEKFTNKVFGVKK